jgi:nucleotide-binding universal stress UspA family protein
MDIELLIVHSGENKMHSLNEILVPVDFSPRSVDAALCAAGVARHFHSRITLLHVLPPINPTWPTMANAEVLDDVIACRKEETRSRLNRFLAEELRCVEVNRVVVDGYPAEAIAEYAAAHQVGLIMMPTRGCTAFRRFLLGSVAAKVLHDVACPVWTSSHVTEGRPTVSVIPKVIACAIDPNPDGERILQWASNLASHLDARLIVAHAIPSLEFRPETYFLEADMRKLLIGDARAMLGAMLQSSRTPDAEVRVEGGSVTTVIRSVVEDSHADLLIIGRASGKGMLGRLRTHSYALIRESPCPVISI